MSVSVCRCCGEAIAQTANQHSRHPHLCASCSSLLDGLTDPVGVSPSEPIPQSEPPVDPNDLREAA